MTRPHRAPLPASALAMKTKSLLPFGAKVASRKPAPREVEAP
jgi:hypothetical protein